MGNHGLSNVYLVKTDEKSGLSLNSVDNFAAVRVMAQIKRRSCFVLIYAGCVQTLEESEGGARRPVSRVLSLPRGQGMAIHLGRPLPGRLTRPTRMAARKPARTRRFCHPYLVLLPVGFALPPPLPAARCALTAPFHPCRPIATQAPRGGWRCVSVALSLGSPPPGVTRHRASMEPGLSSPASWRRQPSGRLAQR